MQAYKDKINFRDKLKSGEKIILELGGGGGRKEGRINIDILDLPQVDIVADLEKGLSFIPDNCVDEIKSTSFFEHIDNFDFLMREIHRVLKPSGKLKVFVPHFSNPYYYSDYTHKRFFGYYTFYYFSDKQNRLRRRVPSFYTNYKFEVISQKLIFTSPFLFTRIPKQVMGKLINTTILFQEIYEAHLTSFFSCYAITAELRAVK